MKALKLVIISLVSILILSCSSTKKANIEKLVDEQMKADSLSNFRNSQYK